jgi:DNA-directed RNA polymerase specialized sigma subunit
MYHNIIYLIIFINLYVIKAFYNFNNFVSNWQINKNKNKSKNKNIIKIEEYRFYETNKYDIFKKYIGYAVFHAIKFKKTYKIIIRNNEELYMYSKMGLYKAIMNYDFNYNYKTNFLLYIKKYIYAELYNYMCDTKTLTLLPKHIRKYKKCLPANFK